MDGSLEVVERAIQLLQATKVTQRKVGFAGCPQQRHLRRAYLTIGADHLGGAQGCQSAAGQRGSLESPGQGDRCFDRQRQAQRWAGHSAVLQT